MAQVTSGTVKSNTLWYSTFYVKWTRTSYSVENNTSTINWEAGLITSNGVYWQTNAVKINSIYIDGSVVLSAKTYSNISGNGTHKLASGTKTINHNNDGTKSFNISINGWLYDTGSPTGSSKFELPTIPRASTITVTDANIGSVISIIISKKESSHIHTLTYSFGSLTGTIATKTSDSTIGFTLPTGFYSQIPNAKSGTGTIYCTTYTASGTQVGSTQSSTFTATTNENQCKPAISLTAVDNNATTKALTGDSNKFIKYFSNANVILTTTAKNNATISSTKITAGDGKISNSANTTFNNVESASFTGSTTDSRGYSASTTLNKTLINYIKLTCNVEIYRPEPTTGEVYLRVNGNYFNNTFGAVVNTITLQYRYKESTSNTWSNWTSITATKSGNTYSYKGSLGTTFDYTKSYNFQVNAYDKLMNLTENKTVSQGIPVFDWGENDFNFNVPVKGLNMNSYFSGVVSGASWYYVGDIQMNGQGSYAILDCYLGNGQNGNAYQNTHMQVLLKQGWGGDTNPIGITARFSQNYSELIKVGIAFISNNNCKLYMYLPFNYNDLTYVINGSYKSFIPVNNVLNSKPTYEKEATYYKLVKEEKSVVANENGTKSYVILGNTLICWGRVAIAVSSANTPTSVSITFPKVFAHIPNVQVTPITYKPGTVVLETSTDNVTTSGCDIYITTATSNSIAVNWMAIGDIS